MVIAIVLTSILGVGTVAFWQSQRNNNTETNTELETKVNEDDTVVEKAVSLPSINSPIDTSSNSFTGHYVGNRASLITNAIVFPKSELKIKENKDFRFEASGLDLDLLGFESLKIDDQYPKVLSMIEGKIETNTDKNSSDFVSTYFEVDFEVGGQRVSPENKLKLLNDLETLGINIPKATEESPIVLNVDIVLENSKILIQSTKKSDLVVKFEGSKKQES